MAVVGSNRLASVIFSQDTHKTYIIELSFWMSANAMAVSAMPRRRTFSEVG